MDGKKYASSAMGTYEIQSNLVNGRVVYHNNKTGYNMYWIDITSNRLTGFNRYNGFWLVRTIILRDLEETIINSIL